MLLSHTTVLAIGAALVLPAFVGGALPARAVALQRDVFRMTYVRSANAIAVTQAAKEPPAEQPALLPLEEPRPSLPPAPPGPPPFNAPPPGSGGEGVAAIYAVFGDSPGLQWALRVAYCESRYNPLAINKSSGASGLFQFMPATWNAHFAGWNIWDPYAQARAALQFYNAGATNAWVCK
jgi:soluble lytic murein transglycosylase-like protein